jgi:C1A family cysteine protease
LQFNKQPDFEPSRLFAYYIARTDDNKEEDSGASIRDAFKAINNYGICDEKYWPYFATRFAVKPPKPAWIDATSHQSVKYERIYPVAKDLIMDALNNGYAIVFGIILHESFMSEKAAKTGMIPNPCLWEEEIGGHCMTMFDYNKDGVFVLNSWGETWGDGGVCLIPWEYVLSKHTSDCWVFYETE